MSHFIEAVNGLKFLNWDLESTKSSEIAVLKKTINEAIYAGYRHFDTARIYGSEEALGQVISNSGIARKEFFSNLQSVDNGFGV